MNTNTVIILLCMIICVIVLVTITLVNITYTIPPECYMMNDTMTIEELNTSAEQLIECIGNLKGDQK